MRIVHIAFGTILLLLSGSISAPGAEQPAAPDRDAGTWKTWLIPSGKDLRVPAPPDRSATEKELGEVANLAASRDKAALDKIAYWDTGAPSYRWSELATAEYMKAGQPWQLAARGLSLMHVAIYD